MNQDSFPHSIDAHCHLSDRRWQAQDEWKSVIERAISSGVGEFFLGGVGPEEWQIQKKILTEYPGRIYTCFGLHPWWIAEHALEDCDQGVLQLKSEVLECRPHALGECGLDFGQKTEVNSREKQKIFFKQQLIFASQNKLSVVLHIVKAQEEALKILDELNAPIQGMVHSFSGSFEKAKPWLDRHFLISIGARFLGPHTETLRAAIRKIPLDQLVLETDSPDQPPFSQRGECHEPTTLIDIAREIGLIRSEDPHLILKQSRINLGRVYGF